MNRNLFFSVALSATLLCGWLTFSTAIAAEPEAAPAPAVPAPAAEAAPRAAAAAEAATPAAPAAAAQAAAPADAAGKPEAAQSTAAAAQPAAANDGDQIVCKTQDVFGSRVRKTKVCRTKKEWQMETQAAKDFSKGVSKGNSAGPGGQGLPVGD